MDNDELLGEMRHKQHIKRLLNQQKAKELSGEIRIGKRNPNDGTYQAIRPNGYIEKGIKTSNGATNLNQVVRGIKAGNIWALDWKNVLPKTGEEVATTQSQIAYLYTIDETNNGITLRNFYIGGLTSKPIALPSTMSISDLKNTNADAYITLRKGVCYVDILYFDILDNNSENRAYLIQWDSQSKKVVKTRQDWTYALVYAGNNVWNTPVAIPGIAIISNDTGTVLTATGSSANFRFIPFSGSYTRTGSAIGQFGSGAGSFSCSPWSILFSRKGLTKSLLSYSGNNSDSFSNFAHYSQANFNKIGSGTLLLPCNVTNEIFSLSQYYSTDTVNSSNETFTTQFAIPIIISTDGSILYRREFNSRTTVKGAVTQNISYQNTYFLKINNNTTQFNIINTNDNFLGIGNNGYGWSVGLRQYIDYGVSIPHAQTGSIPAPIELIDAMSNEINFTTWVKNKFYYYPSTQFPNLQTSNPKKITIPINVYQISPSGSTLNFTKKQVKMQLYTVKQNPTLKIYSLSIQP